MYSLAWPDMFSKNNVDTNLFSDKEAIASNLIHLLNSEKRSLFGDPYFGSVLKTVLYQQNSSILIDQITDELYSTIRDYMPQISVRRDDIQIRSFNDNLIGTILVTYLADNTTDLYSINLTDDIQEG